MTLPPTCLRVRAGERFRLVVAGGAFPRFARSPGTGESPATATTFHVARIAVHHDTEHPSRLALPAGCKRYSFHSCRCAGPSRRSGLIDSDGIWRAARRRDCLSGGGARRTMSRCAAPRPHGFSSWSSARRAGTRLPHWVLPTRRASNHSCRRRLTVAHDIAAHDGADRRPCRRRRRRPTSAPPITTALPEPTMYRPEPIRSGTLVTATVMPVVGVLDGSTVTFQIVEMPDGPFLQVGRLPARSSRRGPNSGRSASTVD